MSWVPPPGLWERVSREDRERARMASYASNPAVVQRVSQGFIRNNWVNPRVVVPLVLSGVPDDVMDELAARVAYAQAEQDPTDIGRTVQAGVKNRKRKKGGLLGGLGNFLADNPVTNALQSAGGVALGAAGRVAGAALGAADNRVTRGITRSASTALQAPFELVTTQAAKRFQAGKDLLKSIGEGDVGAAFKDAFQLTTGLVTPEDFETTTLYQAIRTGDLGSGYFAGGEAVQQQAEAARRIRGTIGESAWTLGRALASVVTQPGTEPYNVLSGLVDLSAATLLDPTNIAGSGIAASRAVQRVGSNVVAVHADDIRRSAGLIPSSRRPTVFVPAADRWLAGRDGQRAVESLAFRYNRPSEVWEAFDRRISPTLAAALADAHTPEDVLPIIREALVSGSIREIPHVGFFTANIGTMKMRVSSHLSNRFRSLNQVPDTILDWQKDPTGSVKNLDDSLRNLDMNIERRRRVVDKYIRAVATGEGEQVREALNTMTDAVRVTLIEEITGIPEAQQTAKTLEKLSREQLEFIERVTKWNPDHDLITNYWVESLGRGIRFRTDKGDHAVPAAFVDLLRRSAWVYDPTAIRDIRRWTSRYGRFLNSKTGKIIDVPATTVDAIQQTAWKPAAIIRPAYLARVLPEELMRVGASGAFDSALSHLAWMVGRRGTRDATGDRFDIAREIDEVHQQLVKVRRQRVAARDAAIPDNWDDPLVWGDEIETLMKEETELGARLRRLQERIEDDYRVFAESQISSRGWALEDLKIDLSRDRDLMLHRTGNRPIVNKESNPAQWVEGHGQLFVRAMFDPVLKRVANGGLYADEIPDALTARGLDQVNWWLLNNTEGQTVLRRMRVAKEIPESVTDEELAAEYVNVSRQIIESLTGSAQDLRQAIATGMIGEARIGTWSMKGGYQPSDALTRRLWEFRNDPSAPLNTVWAQTLRSDQVHNLPVVAKQFFQLRDWAVDKFFTELYGKSSDYLARSPLFRKRYWDRAAELAANLSPEEAAKLVANAEKAGVSGRAMALLRRNAAHATGEGDLEMLDDLARGFALDEVKRLLYDSSQRSQWFDIARIIFPFGEAYREVLTRWASLITERPHLVNRFSQTVDAARNTKINEGDQGFFYRDPISGQEVFNYTLTGPLTKLLTGTEMPMVGSVQGLSLATSIIPGVGPVASIALADILPDVPGTEDLRELLFPYGEPSGGFDLRPAWLQKAFAAWQADESNAIYANTKMEVYSALLASGEYDMSSPDDREALEEEATTRARWLTGFRAFVQFGAPSAPIPQYIAETENGDVVAATLAQEYGRLWEEDPQTATERFLAEFGEGAAIYMASKSNTLVGGIKATRVFADFERTHKSLFKKYRDVAGYFGPQDEGFDYAVYDRQIQAGLRERQSPEDRMRDANAIVAAWKYREVRKAVGANPTFEQRLFLRNLREELARAYPGYNPDSYDTARIAQRVRDLREAVQDPSLAGNMTAVAVRDYLTLRDALETEAEAMGVIDWKNAKATATFRQVLRLAADELINRVPGFFEVWDQVFERELKDDASDTSVVM